MIGGFKNRNMESPLSVVLCNSANACSSLCVNATGSEHYKHFGEPLNNFSRFLDHICKEYSLEQVITASLVYVEETENMVYSTNACYRKHYLKYSFMPYDNGKNKTASLYPILSLLKHI